MQLKSWHALALVSCALWVAYYPALFAPLNPVDDVRMVNYLLNHPGIGWSDVLFPPSSSYYRPVVRGSFILDLLIWNLETPFLHLENVLLHWINTLLVFSLTRAFCNFLKHNNVVLPFVASLIFALHPLNTEAVIWVAGRADIMATTGVLCALICTIYFYSRKSLLWLMPLSITFLLGCLAKETALFLLPGLALMAWLKCRSDARGSLKSYLFSGLPTIVCSLGAFGYFLLRSYALHGRDIGLRHVNTIVQDVVAVTPGMDVSSVTSMSGQLLGRIQIVLSAAGFYLRKVLQPLPLNFGIIDVADSYMWVGIMLLLLSALLLTRLSWANCFLLTAMSLGSVALLVALGDISWTPIAERYMYAPTAMVAIGGTLGAAPFLRNSTASFNTVATIMLMVVLFIAGGAVFQRSLVWQDNLTLYQDTVEKSPDFAMAKSELAGILWQREHKDEALEILRSLDVPEFQVASLNKVLLFVEEGRFEEARAFLLKRLNSPEPATYRVEILERLVKVLEAMISQTDDSVQIRNHQDEMLGYLEEILRLTQNPFCYYRIGRLQMIMGETKAASESFSTALRELPEDSIYREPSRKLAETLSKQ